MLTGGGFHRGTSILLSGVAGAGKSSLAAAMVDATCRAGERALYLSFEESPQQATRNMRSVGLDLGRWIDEGKLRYQATRPTFYSLEMHLAIVLREVTRFRPSLVVLDPISAFTESGDRAEVQSMLLRIVDYLKAEGITGVFTHLMQAGDTLIRTDAGLSSLMDAWILLLNREMNGEFNRELYLLKARGMRHSNQVREFVMSETGIRLIPPYLGEGKALTGSARIVEEARLRREEVERHAAIQRARAQIEQRRRRARAQMEILEADLAADEAELSALLDDEERIQRQRIADQEHLATSRRA
jgi:circadian clock protein KaiC